MSPAGFARYALNDIAVDVFTAQEWSYVTLITGATGVYLGGTGAQAAGKGFPLPADVPVRLLVAPETVIFAYGPNGSYISTAVQRLPLLMRLFAALGRAA